MAIRYCAKLCSCLGECRFPGAISPLSPTKGSHLKQRSRPPTPPSHSQRSGCANAVPVVFSFFLCHRCSHQLSEFAMEVALYVFSRIPIEWQPSRCCAVMPQNTVETFISFRRRRDKDCVTSAQHSIQAHIHQRRIHRSSLGWYKFN